MTFKTAAEKNSWSKKYYENNKQYFKDKNKAARKAAKAFVDSLKTACSRCGYDRCKRALGFHHRGDDKEFNVSAIRVCSKEKLLAEIAKCDLLCANCHMETHCG